MKSRLMLSMSVAVTMFLMVLSGCGGGSSSGGPSTPPAVTTVDMTGKVADGYIQGATVCLDKNNNKQCDSDEPTATTGSGGSYTITGVPNADAAAYPVIALVPAGAIDSDNPGTPIAQGYILSTPPGKHAFISPLTTLVHQEMYTNGGNVASAEATIKSSLGVTTSGMFEDYVDKKAAGNDYMKVANAARVVAAGMGEAKSTLASSGTPSDTMNFTMNTIKTNLPTIVASVSNSAGIDTATISGIVSSKIKPVITTTAYQTAIGGQTTVGISISPAAYSVTVGGNVTFTANVTGTSNTAVTWSATGGSVTAAGAYTAPTTAGTYTVKATSVADTSKSASATVTVTAPVVSSKSLDKTTAEELTTSAMRDITDYFKYFLGFNFDAFAEAYFLNGTSQMTVNGSSGTIVFKGVSRNTSTRVVVYDMIYNNYKPNKSGASASILNSLLYNGTIRATFDANTVTFTFAFTDLKLGSDMSISGTTKMAVINNQQVQTLENLVVTRSNSTVNKFAKVAFYWDGTSQFATNDDTGVFTHNNFDVLVVLKYTTIIPGATFGQMVLGSPADMGSALLTISSSSNAMTIKYYDPNNVSTTVVSNKPYPY